MSNRTATQLVAWALARAPGGKFLMNLSIGGKLTLGFAVIVVLTLSVVGLSYLSSSQASSRIRTTTELRAPLALASSKAQANLLTILGDVRGYLALGDEEYRTGYDQASAAFEEDLAELERLLSENPNEPSMVEMQTWLGELQA